MTVIVPKPGEVLESEYYSDSTNRSAYIFKTHEDYRIVFVELTPMAPIFFEDWRDSYREAVNAAEDWVLSD